MENKDKSQCEKEFLEHFKMTREDLKILWRWFLEYGMTVGQNDPKPHRNKANHYFLQEICERYTVDWKGWNKKLTPELKVLVTNMYPQLMTNNKQFEWL